MGILFALHSLWRWVVLILALIVIGKALRGWLGQQTWQDLDKRLGTFYIMAFTVQFVLGLILYLGTLMGAHQIRWYELSLVRLSFEHVLLMLIALGVVHMVPARVRKAGDDLAKHRVTTIGFIISLLLVVVAVPTWGFSF